jgi:hypothetical protein
MCPQGHGGSSPPSDTTDRAAAHDFVFKGNFGGLPPTGPSTGWSHRLCPVDRQSRISIGVSPGLRLSGRLTQGRWCLSTDGNGPIGADARGRLVIPLGVRIQLSVHDVAGVSRRDGALVLWPAQCLDRVAEGSL